MNEIWKDIYYKDMITNEIIDYRNLYKASNLGRIKSLIDNHGNKREKIMSHPLSKNRRYETVCLTKNKKERSFNVHRIIAHLFVKNPNNKKYIDHIIPISDGGTNNADNLRWVDHKENMANELTKNKCNNNNYFKTKIKSVVAINLKTKELLIFNNGETSTEICEMLSKKENKKFDRRMLSTICLYNKNPKEYKERYNRVQKTYKGYTFYYEEDWNNEMTYRELD